MKMPLYSRLLVILGISLIIASIIAEAYGAKTHASHQATVAIGGAAKGLAIYAMSLGGSGKVNVRVNNASIVYYISDISGDIGTLMSSLRVFNISAFNAQTIHDVRVGLVYGQATLKTSKYLLAALPGIAKMLHFSIYRVNVTNGTSTLSEDLNPGEGILVIAIPKGNTISYSLEYNVMGYERISVGSSIGIAGALILLGVIPILLMRERLD